MKLTFDDANTIALMLERKTHLTDQQQHLLRKVRAYMGGYMQGLRGVPTSTFIEDPDYKDHEEDLDGRYR